MFIAQYMSICLMKLGYFLLNHTRNSDALGFLCSIGDVEPDAQTLASKKYLHDRAFNLPPNILNCKTINAVIIATPFVGVRILVYQTMAVQNTHLSNNFFIGMPAARPYKQAHQSAQCNAYA
jgi:hypothetical protein